jgi:tRNA(fMet)-specific endonuclease VapC
MTWLLDTNVWVAYLNPRPSPVRQRLAEAPGAVFICDVVKGELLYGAYRSAQAARNLRTLSELFSTVDSLAFDGPAADAFGRLRAHLASRGTPIGPYDLQIAAIALANDLTLVTHNTREFARVPDLRLADWEA